MARLFRNEVLQARRAALLGSVVLRPPLSFAWWCLGSVAAAGALLALLCFGQYTKRTRIQGITVPSAGVLKLTSPQPGVVVERQVEEGQAVQAGDVLFVVSSERMTEGPGRTGAGAHAAVLEELAQRRASLSQDLERRSGLLEQQSQELARRRAALLLEAGQLRREVATQALRESTAAEQSARFEELVRQGFVSAQSAMQRRDELLDQRARRQALERGVTAIEREVAAVDAELAQVPLRAAQEQAEIGRAIAVLQQEIAGAEAARRVVITAPRDGVVSVVAERGHHVNSQPLATLLPSDASMQAHLFAPSRAVGFVRAGQQVRVRFAAYPFQKFGHYDGEVAQVSRVALPPAELPAQLALPMPHEGLYRVIVRLAAPSVTAYGSVHPLIAGMQVEADVMQDRRRLIEWVFEPLIALGRKI